jgi:O-antigen/teichoic acid export membrane protein
MKKSLIQNLSVNAVQLIVNQVAGLGIFYVLSTSLDKNSFGQINLSLAVLLAAFNILSLGIDQIAIKKIASGSNVNHVLSLYIIHVLLSGLGFYLILFIGYYFFPQASTFYSLLLFIGIGKLMMFFSTPLKQAANGLERFRLLAYMSVISNMIRCIGLVILLLTRHLNIHTVVIIFILGDTAELLISTWLFKFKTATPFTIKWSIIGYKELLLESLPQTGVVLITSALARFDWIFIGFILSAVKLAEYSFAYKVFEISTLPLLAIAPLLIPKFTKLIQQKEIPVPELKILIKVEMIIAPLTILLINVYWAPIIDGITHGKYGLINSTTIFILSLCMPFLYLNNFLWTLYFAQSRMKMILSSFIITFLVNVIGDIILIPFYKNEGAAFAFLISCIVQSIFYLKKNTIIELKTIWYPLIPCMLCALVSGFACRMFLNNNWLIIPASIIIYLLLLIVFKQIRFSDRQKLVRLFNL